MKSYYMRNQVCRTNQSSGWLTATADFGRYLYKERRI